MYINSKSPVIIFMLILISIGQLLLKAGVSGEGDAKLSILKLVNKYIFLAFITYVVVVLLYIYLLSEMPLSTLYPIVGFSYVITSIGAVTLFRESLSASEIGGIALISVGVMILGTQ